TFLHTSPLFVASWSRSHVVVRGKLIDKAYCQRKTTSRVSLLAKHVSIVKAGSTSRDILVAKQNSNTNVLFRIEIEYGSGADAKTKASEVVGRNTVITPDANKGWS